VRILIKSAGKKIIRKLFDRSLDIRIQVFNMLIVISIIAGVYGAIISAALVNMASLIVIFLVIAVIGIAMLIITVIKKYYRICTWIYIVTVFFILFPLLYFTSGSYKGGSYLTFGVAIVFTALLLQGYGRVAVLSLLLIEYAACILTSYYIPETVTVLPTEFDYLFITVVYFISVSVFLLSALLISLRILNERQGQIAELNRELLARNESLKHYDRMKTDFLATVAHEINTPLTVIAASSNDTIDLLDETPLNIDEIRGNQVVIGKRVKLIDRVMLDLMDTVAIETGRLSLRRVPVHLRDLIMDVCDAQHGKQETGDHSVTYELESGLPLILLDPTRIEQVMSNLLSNAFRHTQSGVVLVELKREVGHAGASQVVSVKDDGDGMDDETAQNSLKQYSTTKANRWRHGIGLYICRRIIAAHEGSIRIDSEKGRGTTVTFSINEVDWT
jgi:signal transduction histidine kinase